MTRIFIKAPAALIAFAVLTMASACSSDDSPEAHIPDGPLVPAISLEFAANNPDGLNHAETVCKNHGKTAKLDKTEQRAGEAVNIYKCQ